MLANLNLTKLYKKLKRPPVAISSNAKFNISEFSDPTKKAKYREAINEHLQDLGREQEGVNAEQHLQYIVNAMSEAANTSVGRVPKTNKTHRNGFSGEIEKLAAEKRKLRLDITVCRDGTKVKEMKTRRNRLAHQIRRECLKLASTRLDERVAEIDQMKDDAKMFKATRLLRRQQQSPVVVEDSDGKLIAQPSESVEALRQHFRAIFCDPALESSRLLRTEEDLKNPIKQPEVHAAAKRLNNGRASGPDGIPAELIKYGTPALFSNIATTFNNYAKDKSLKLGDGLLIPIPKPGKKRGPPGNVRPVTLLNTLRKLLSLVILTRIKPAINGYLSLNQSGFRSGRSTGDVVYSYRWLSARCQRVASEISILGIDMSKAFDTISRVRLIDILSTVIDHDELHIIQCLLTDTTIKVKLNNILSQPLVTHNGTPQGDSLSPVLFTVYLEAALRLIRERLSPRPALDIQLQLPNETAYADDVDFISTSLQYLHDNQPILSSSLAEYNLKMNEAKTEYTTIKREKDRVDERWRNTVKLGSMLGVEEDISRRKRLATCALHQLWVIWLRGNHAREPLRIRLYGSFILPILLYNCGTWSLTETQEKKLDSFHRQQLRAVIGVKYPRIIRNEALYKRTGSKPLSRIIQSARWRMFGHMLRLDTSSPVQQAMSAYFQPGSSGFRGRPRTTLPRSINNDLKNSRSTNSLTSHEDLVALRQLAQDRRKWKDLMCAVCNG